jgi:hypothetical protein
MRYWAANAQLPRRGAVGEVWRLQHLWQHIGLAVAAGVGVLVLVLPLILLVACASIARDERRLARTLCTTCGQPIGLEEIRRAKEEALRAAWAGYDPASGIRRRIAPVWDVVCRTCGRRYTYRSGEPHTVLVPVAATEQG